MSKHSNNIPPEEVDKVEELIKNSGCWEEHLRLSDCMIENNDWRKCQKEVKFFKSCMITKQPQQFKDKQKEAQ
uniref:CHCH domain-containing protein n=1 Tax=Parastrongyloides trichosuri TaxID=131310 RepID=A0A0N4ZGH5_PARTI